MTADRPRLASVRQAALGAIAGVAVALSAARFLAPSPFAPPPSAPPAPPPPSSPQAPSAAPSASGSTALEAPSGSASSPLSLAASGDLDELKRLESIDEASRSIDEAQAIAQGRAELARRDLAQLVRQIEADPSLVHDRATLARLHDFVEREPIALDALPAIARLAGEEARDLLHAVWRRHRHTTTGLLARDLLRRPSALEQASPPLRLAIEIERLLDERPDRPSKVERRCQRMKSLVDHVAEGGDRRCLPLLAELEAKSGCGQASDEDCFACLRDSDALRQARDRARTREPPQPWALLRTPR